MLTPALSPRPAVPLTVRSARGACYSLAQLQAAFSAHVESPWVAPQWALVPDFEAAVLVADAFEHFHGSEATIEPSGDVFLVHSTGLAR